MIKLSNRKIGALIPIRLDSERLPNKAIKSLCGKPVVCHLLDRAFKSKYLKKKNVVVCTTKGVSDNPLVEIIENYGASVYRGSKDDIIRRFYDAMVDYNFDYVIQIDGDDITAEPYYMDLTMEKLLADENLDIVTCYGLPLGMGSKSFSMKAMKKVIANYKSTQNDTGFIYFFTKTDFCNHLDLKPKLDHEFEKIRLTLDYQEDFDFFKAIFEELYEEGEVFHIEAILNFVRKFPEIININYFLEKEYWERTSNRLNLKYANEYGEIKRIKLYD